MIEHSLENGKGTGTRLVVDNTNAPALTTQAKCIIQRGVRQTEFGCLPLHFNGVPMTGLGGERKPPPAVMTNTKNAEPKASLPA